MLVTTGVGHTPRFTRNAGPELKSSLLHHLSISMLSSDIQRQKADANQSGRLHNLRRDLMRSPSVSDPADFKMLCVHDTLAVRYAETCRFSGMQRCIWCEVRLPLEAAYVRGMYDSMYICMYSLKPLNVDQGLFDFLVYRSCFAYGHCLFN